MQTLHQHDEATSTEDDASPSGSRPATAADRRRALRWEETASGRAVISFFLVVTLGSILAANLPTSVIKERLESGTRPYLNAFALHQNWAIFSPNPRRETSYVLARVDRADGTVSEWPVTVRRGLGEYADYRWQKFREQLWLGEGARWAWDPYARWIAARDRDAGGSPIRVTVLRRTSESLAPGPGPDRGPWRDEVLFTRSVVVP